MYFSKEKDPLRRGKEVFIFHLHTSAVFACGFLGALSNLGNKRKHMGKCGMKLKCFKIPEMPGWCHNVGDVSGNEKQASPDETGST